MSGNDLQYHKRSTKEVQVFVEGLQANSINENGVFDSVASDEFISGALSQNSAPVPSNLQVLFDEVGSVDGGVSSISHAILDGINTYKSQHGCDVPADVLEQAFQLAYATTDEARKNYSLDSANSNASDPLSLQPNRAVIAILSALGEAIPFAHYLPADIQSNEAKLAILSHLAGTKYGAYALNGLLDGTNSGDAYVTSARIHATTNAAGAHSGQLTSVQLTDETCETVANGAVAVPLMHGRTLVYVNGMVVAQEVSSTGAAVSTVSGSVVIGATTHQIGGTVNIDTGVIAITSTPALNNAIPVVVEGFIDYERAPELTPSIITNVQTYKLFAKPYRVITRQTIDSRTQMSNELGLDPYSESIIAIQAQYGNERHYEVLRKARRLALNNVASFDFGWATLGLQKTRAQIWQDFSAVIGAVSQQMAVDTLSHGISHIYVGAHVMSQMIGLPRDLFTPSGITAKPYIYRVGKLFGMYDVYYTPKVLTDTVSTSQILCIGKANDVTRNAFVLGDAVPATVIPLSVGSDLRQGAGFYARNFTSVNPHAPSALGCAMITVTNMGL